MSYNSPESKLRILASQSTALQAIFGTNPFRWFDTQNVPGYISQGACVRVRRVSTIREYSMKGINDLSQPRFQLDVLDFSAESTRSGAAAVIDWLGTICLATNNQFGSPATTPPQFPNFVLNQRDGLEPNPTKVVFSQSIDVRVYNLESV